MTRFSPTFRRIVRPVLVALSTMLGFGLAATAFLMSLQNSLAAG